MNAASGLGRPGSTGACRTSARTWAEFNEVLVSGRAEAEEERWAYIILDREWLEEHRVY
ncbi:hypothetical protein ACFVY1_44290 [Streptomyces sp. NPDC058293]|uniref:hypothetical protein n=1 Tax=Streptomyces sp. NPDC058293 TaxID=3346429 RepID=UPI0036E7C9D6